MTLGLLAAGPLSMLFSLLLMQGLSLTMWRTFLNQAIPRLDPMQFRMSMGNDQQKAPSSPQVDQSLLPYLQILAPMLLQQHLQQRPQQPMMTAVQPLFQQVQPVQPVQTVQTVQPVQAVQPFQLQQVQPVQPVVQVLQPAQQRMMTAPAIQAQTYHIPQTNGLQMPHVIIVPQMIPQNDKGSASTNMPVQVEAPQGNFQSNDKALQQITRRMLERPPKTTRRPKVIARAHAGTLHVQFATPRAPAGFRRFIIPPVTANIGTDMELSVTTPSYDLTMSPNGYYSGSQSSNYVTEDSAADRSDDRSAKPETSTLSMNENLIESNDIFNAIGATSAPTITTSSVDTTNVTSDRMTSNELMNRTAIVETKTSNETKDNSMEAKEPSKESEQPLDDLIHEDYIRYVKNLNNHRMDSQQSRQQIYFENSKGHGSHEFKRVCFYLLRAKDGDLNISSIDPFICSHLIIGFASVTANNLVAPPNPTEDPEKYRELTNLKSINRKLKVMLSIGDGSGAAFSKMVSTEKSRDTFVASVLDFCDAFDFDGVDIDWEYPYFRTGSKEDKNNFVFLLKEIRSEAVRRFRDNFIISATVGTPLIIAMSSYDIPLIGEAVDFVNLMTYDFNVYRTDRPYTGHHSPLYPRPTEKQYFQTLNAAWSATYWANYGMPLHKIVLGIPTYARTYSLVVPVSQGLEVPVSGPGLGGGKLNYTAVCHFLSSGATREFDIYSQVPFAYKNFDWVAYESEISAALKAQWVVKAHMGGVMTFALNYDDVQGVCRRDGKKFPIQKAISNLLELSSIKAYRDSDHSPDITPYMTKDKM